MWDEENVTQLLTDIAEQASALTIESYFIGMVLVAPTYETDVYEVIDGQQRLTTLFLMMLAIRNRIKVAKVDGVGAVDNLLEETAFGRSGKPETKQHLTPKYENGERVMRLLIEAPTPLAALYLPAGQHDAAGIDGRIRTQRDLAEVSSFGTSLNCNS